MRVSPLDDRVVLVCTYSDGVFKSTDGGTTWAQSTRGLSVWATRTLEFDTCGGAVYLGTYQDGIYKSTDGGQNWRKISANISATDCFDLAFDLYDTTTIFAAVTLIPFRSVDKGATWQYMNVGIPFYNSPRAVMFDSAQAHVAYMSSLTWNLLAGLPTGFYRSTNDGDSWAFLNNGLPGDQGYVDIAISYSAGGARRIFLASSQGVYHSDDIGESWILCEGGLPTTPFYTVVEVAPGNQNIIAAGEGYSGLNRVFISTDRGDTWAVAAPLPPGYETNIEDMGFDPLEENHLYVASSGLGLFETADLGQSWSNITGGIPLEPGREDRPYVSAIAINPLNPSNMFISSCHMGVYQSHDGGHTWESFNVGLDTTVCYGKIVFVPGDTTTLFFATPMRSVWSIHRTLEGVSQEEAQLPGKMNLAAYPNPFNAATLFNYNMPASGPVTLAIYDLLGRKVAALYDGLQSLGPHRQAWDAGDFPSGIYFGRLQVGGKAQNIKVTLVR